MSHVPGAGGDYQGECVNVANRQAINGDAKICHCKDLT